MASNPRQLAKAINTDLSTYKPTRQEIDDARESIMETKGWGEVPENVSFGEMLNRIDKKYPYLGKDKIRKYLVEDAKIDYKDEDPYEVVMNKYRDFYQPPTLKERFDRYINDGFRGDYTDYWNNEIAEIEKQLPFKDQEEHNKWLDLGSRWSGEPEYLDLTNEIIKRVK